MLNLRTKGLNNAAAVLGGYDAMVKAGFTIETGNPKAAPAPSPAPAANIARPATAAQDAAKSDQSSQAAPATMAAQTRHAKRRKAKTRH